MNTMTEMLETRRKAQQEHQPAMQSQQRPMRGYANYADSAKSESEMQKDYEKRYNEFQHHNQRMPKGDELDKWYDKHMSEKAKKASQDFIPGPRQMMEGAAQQRAEKALKVPSLDESMGGKTRKLAMG